MSEHLAYFAGGSIVHPGRRRDCTDMVCFEEEEWLRTGRIRCQDCNALVTARTLETLPDHRCSQRQRVRREREAQQ